MCFTKKSLYDKLYYLLIELPIKDNFRAIDSPFWQIFLAKILAWCLNMINITYIKESFKPKSANFFIGGLPVLAFVKTSIINVISLH